MHKDTRILPHAFHTPRLKTSEERAFDRGLEEGRKESQARVGSLISLLKEAVPHLPSGLKVLALAAIKKEESL